MRAIPGRFVLLLTAGLIALAALLAGPRSAQAGPPAPVDIPLTQPDGTTILARQWGDERQHGYETVDGYTLLQAPGQTWVYAVSDGQGGLVPAQDTRGNLLVAGRADPSGLAQHARPAPPPAEAQSAAPMVLPPVSTPPNGLNLNTVPFAGSRGTQPVLVLLAEFTNRAHRYDAGVYQHSLFGETDSVRAFYRQASFNKLDLAPAAESFGGPNDGVVGWLTLPMTHPNDPFESGSIVSAALTAADPYVNFKAYDQNGDGFLSNNELHLVVVVAGYELSYCGSPCSAGPGIWAHRLALDAYGLYPRLDGTYLAVSRSPDTLVTAGGGYTIFGEIHGAGWDDHPATIGVMAHELGHDLALPDLYDVTNTSAGVGRWSIMGSGSWNGLDKPGDTPALPDAWSKWYEGWISPSTGTDGSSVYLGAAEMSPLALLLGANENGVDWAFGVGAGTGEYWLVENREPIGFDAALPGCGLLVWHIDETLAPDNNANANRDHPLIELEQADGLRDLYNRTNRGDAGDPFPGTSGNLAFGPNGGQPLNPSSRYYNTALGLNGFSTQSFDFSRAYCNRSMPLVFHNLLPGSSSGLGTPLKQTYVPVVQNLSNSAAYSGQATANGQPLEGALLRLVATYQAADGWMTTTTTDVSASDTDGSFAFPRLPRLGGVNHFVVRYENNTNTNTRLLRFTCATVSGSPGDRYNCSPNLANIPLVAPQSGAVTRAPVTLQWTPRSTPTDSYVVEIYSASGQLIALSNPLGYTDHLSLPALPSSLFQPNTIYLWTVRVVTPDGEGYAYSKNVITFSDLGPQGAPALMASPGE